VEQEVLTVLILYLVQSLQLVAEVVEETLLQQELLVDLEVVVLGEVVLAEAPGLQIKVMLEPQETHLFIEVEAEVVLVKLAELIKLTWLVVMVFKHLLMELLPISLEEAEAEAETFPVVKVEEVMVLTQEQLDNQEQLILVAEVVETTLAMVVEQVALE